MNINSAGKELMNILDYNCIANTEGVKLAFPKHKWQIFLGFIGSGAQKILSPCKTNKTYR